MTAPQRSYGLLRRFCVEQVKTDRRNNKENRMDLALSIMMLAIVGLVAGAWFAFRRGQRRQAWLMLILAVVMAVNVGIWTIPTQSGATLKGAAPTQ